MDVTKPHGRRSAGFTLLELLTTGSVTLILTAVAVPALSRFQTVQETSAAANALVGTLAMARHTAVTEQVSVVVCPSSDGMGCSDGFDWSQGWLVFADTDGDRRPDPEERTLLTRQQASRTVQIVTSTGRPKVVYQCNGSAGGTNATFHICNAEDPDRRRAVIVSPSGRTRLSRRDSGGGYISCE